MELGRINCEFVREKNTRISMFCYSFIFSVYHNELQSNDIKQVTFVIFSSNPCL